MIVAKSAAQEQGSLMGSRLENKVAVVTGAGRGIGQAIARKLAEEGAAVTIAEVDPRTGEPAASELRAAGYRVQFTQTDITQEAQVKAAMEQTAAAFGKVDILVNNAGKNFYYEASTMTEAEWDGAMQIDVKGAWLCCKHVFPHMVKAGGGAIVNIASLHARMTYPGYFPYAAAKSALVGMTRNLALDWGKHNIRVNAICPGWVLTPLAQEWFDQQADPQAAWAQVLSVHPLGRVGRPEDIANFVAFVASDEAAFITGAELTIDGGLGARYAG
jgi:NAD(P)-dependent dehydrogenase (short-subunit alcohol dehydrogenase family)